MVKYSKPKSFYDTFERKGQGQKVTHYCPGCGHGTAHKLIAEAIDEFEIQDRVVFCSPVGCSVFAYYYFDTGNIQCAHGRAPAVATGVRRTLDDAIVISYQGDGDLAGIGMAEIVHAANRGENITVFFINNAIYGMTGGQMAPTTLVGQKTLTTPRGRSLALEGNPIGMCELIDSLVTPVYVERVSLADGARVMRARKAIRKALKNQIEGRGFSFVEVLSPCPVNWKMTPIDARKWIKDELEPVFPVRNFRDSQTGKPERSNGHRSSDAELLSILRSQKEVDSTPEAGPAGEQEATSRDQYVKIAGFGGQGVLSAGVLLANCGTVEGLHATWLPSYGPEMRGGTANASVILSDDVIGSPLVDRPNLLIAMNGPSLDAFEESVRPDGLVVVNSSIITRKPERTDIRFLPIPASDIAKEHNFLQGANVVLLAVCAAVTGRPALKTLREVIPHSLKRKNLADVNLKLVDAALAYLEANPNGGYPA
ncbi:2-oxoacid:acceptor oxidoreductase family protein [Salinispira pacifica]